MTLQIKYFKIAHVIYEVRFNILIETRVSAMPKWIFFKGENLLVLGPVVTMSHKLIRDIWQSHKMI